MDLKLNIQFKHYKFEFLQFDYKLKNVMFLSFTTLHSKKILKMLYLTFRKALKFSKDLSINLGINLFHFR